METDADGATDEAHITMADGTHAAVLLDANFAVTATQDLDQGGLAAAGAARVPAVTAPAANEGGNPAAR